MFRPDDKNAEPIVFERNGASYCLVPLSVPVGQPRGLNSRLVLNVSVSQRPKEVRNAKTEEIKNDEKESEDEEWCDPEQVDKPNLLSGFRGVLDGTGGSTPIFSHRIASSTPSMTSTDPSNGAREGLPERRVVRKFIPVRAPLTVSIRTSSISNTEHMLCVTVSLKQCEEFYLHGVNVNVPNAVVTEYVMAESDFDLFRCLLRSTDEITLLYNFSLLDDAQSSDFQNETSNDTQSIMPIPTGMSRNTSITSLTSVLPREENGRWVTITVRGAPVAKGLEDQVLVSKWNFNLDQPRPNGGLAARRGGQDEVLKTPISIPAYDRENSTSQQQPSSGYWPRRSSTGFASAVQNRGSNLHERSWNRDHRGGGLRSIVQKFSRRRHSLTGGVSNPSNVARSNIKVGSTGILQGSLDSVFETKSVAKNTECVVVSFSVSLDITFRKVFTLRVFIVNRTNRLRDLTLMIPNRRTARPSMSFADCKEKPVVNKSERSVADRPVQLYMNEAEFLRRYMENEKKEANVVCLENNVRLSPLHPMTCQSINLHFVAIKEHLHTIDLIQLQDNDSGVVVNMTDVLEIYVKGQEEADGVEVEV